MNYKNENFNNIINNWLNYREEELSVLTENDKNYNIFFDEHLENIIKNVSPNNKKYVINQLDQLDKEFSDYTFYWNQKYYKSGFKDAIKLLLFGISNN